MKRNSLPTLVCWLLESVTPAAYREAMLGDLVEEYTLRAASTSPRTAARWLWSQTGRSVPPLVWSSVKSSLRSGNWLISMSVAMGISIFMGMLKVAADLAISKLIAPQQWTQVVLAPIVFLTTTAIGGCVAARIRRGSMICLALIVMITVAVLMEVKVCTIPVPWWYQCGFLILGPLTVLLAPSMVGVLVPADARSVK
jgi:hypothetical protein